jgi:hypothetical protein
MANKPRATAPESILFTRIAPETATNGSETKGKTCLKGMLIDKVIDGEAWNGSSRIIANKVSSSTKEPNATIKIGEEIGFKTLKCGRT